MASQIVPLANSPDQSIQVILAVNNNTLTMNLRVYFNTYQGCWMMDIADQFGAPLISSIPVVTGVWPAGNILSAWDYMQIGAAYLVNQNGSTADIPNASSLGSDFVLLWDDNPSFAGGDNPSVVI